MIVTFAEKSTPVWEIPFPSVTICPEMKAKQTAFNYTNICNQLKENPKLNNFTNDEYVCHHYTVMILNYLNFFLELIN